METFQAVTYWCWNVQRLERITFLSSWWSGIYDVLCISYAIWSIYHIYGIYHVVHITYSGIWTLGYLLENSNWNYTHLNFIRHRSLKSLKPVVDTFNRSLKFTLWKLSDKNFPMGRKGMSSECHNDMVSTAENTSHISLGGTPSISGERLLQSNYWYKYLAFL